jgi:phosphate transport system substrate-binding protein
MALKRAIIAVAMWALATTAQAAETSGAGSTFVFPIIAKWAAGYQAKTGNQIKYDSIGSGRGIAEIKSGTVDFGASDMPLKPDELQKLGLGQFPLVIGGVVPIFNVEGIKAGELRFSGPVLADIFLGKIKTWNDTAIQKLNPGLKLPSSAITVVHRLDGSGTTFNFLNYLSKVSPEWRDKVGEGTAVEWPTGVGAKGNEGVAVFVNQTRSSIGYVEYAYAVQTKLAYGLVQNKAGQFIQPGAESFAAAAAAANWGSTKDFYLILTDAPGEKAYPIAATAFMLMYKQAKNPERATVAVDFFKWALERGQTDAGSLNYVPLPADLVQQIETYWKAEFAGWKG